MIGREALWMKLERALAGARGEAVAVIESSSAGLTRFAGSVIHQHVNAADVEVAFRARVDGGEGTAMTNGLDDAALAAALRRAEAIARANPARETLPPPPGPQTYDEVATFVEATAAYSPDDRVRQVGTVFELAAEAGAKASGLLSTGRREVAIVNTAGLHAYAPLTDAELMVIVDDGPASGFAGAASRDVDAFDVAAAARRAVAKCVAARNRRDIEPGEYEVILEPAAVAAALAWISYVGFGSQAEDDGASFLTGREGRQLVGENITIVDDAADGRAVGLPFDFEGMPKTRVAFLERGEAGRTVTDLAAGARQGRPSSGHAAPPAHAGRGAMALNVVMEGGDAELAEMVAGVARGILVTRFHYVNGMLDPRNAVLTGMTRDGTFVIEDGRVVASLPNLRFLQSFVDVFARTTAVSRRTETHAGWGPYGAWVAPALRVDGFRFVGVQKED